MVPHYAQTAPRMRGHAVVLCLQDTTELDFNGQDIPTLTLRFKSHFQIR
jgi:hypothetical protein